MQDAVDTLEEEVEDSLQNLLLEDNPALPEEILREKLEFAERAFSDPILQHQYLKLIHNPDELLSLDSVIALGKVRLNIAARKGKPMEVAQLLRSVTEAIERAMYVRAQTQEFVHLEQVLWLLDELFKIVNEEVSSQADITKVASRLSRLKLVAREDVPLEKKRMARMLIEGRRAD